MELAAAYVAMMRRIDQALDIPPVRRLYLPPATAPAEKYAEFGLLELADGSAGLVYLLLDDVRARAVAELDAQSFEGRSAYSLAAGYPSDDPLERTLALGAINAISQSVMRRAGMSFGAPCDVLELLIPLPGERLGMVGYFPPLVDRLRSRGTPTTVIELDPERVRTEGVIEVTLDPGRLVGCSRILCTATTLLNGSLSRMIEYGNDPDCFALVGPSAGLLPDPLFEIGVDVIAGSQVLDARRWIENCRAERSWGESVQKYCLHRDTYPGLDALLEIKSRRSSGP